MRSFLNIVLMILFAFLTHKFIPFWWFFAIATFLVSFAFGESTLKSFFTGFISVFLLWLSLSIVISVSNNFILIEKVGALLSLPSSILLIPITAFLGGILGALASVSGYLLKTISD